MLTGRFIVIGVTGGIAAYKACELVSLLSKRGATVQVVMTENATQFVHPLTFQTLSGRPVIHSLFQPQTVSKVEHVDLGVKADLIAIVPATANIIGKLAHGIADDFLTTLVLAAKGSVLVAPAMNSRMYVHRVVQANLNELRALGYRIVAPATGTLACGEEGVGRLADPESILAEIEAVLAKSQDWAGLSVLVTAGGTREAIDPVRFLGNRSSGKMGYAIAQAALQRGARVSLITGPSTVIPPPCHRVVKVETAEEMYAAVLDEFADTDVVIKAAAVADYRPKVQASVKIKKDDQETLVLELERTPDILSELGRRKGRQILIGFAAESNNLVDYAQAKIRKKNLDLVVANQVGREGVGFETDTNEVSIISSEGLVKTIPLASKTQIAHEILDEVMRLPRFKQLRS